MMTAGKAAISQGTAHARSLHVSRQAMMTAKKHQFHRE